jgi:hypothetical protein
MTLKVLQASEESLAMVTLESFGLLCGRFHVLVLVLVLALTVDSILAVQLPARNFLDHVG